MFPPFGVTPLLDRNILQKKDQPGRDAPEAWVSCRHQLAPRAVVQQLPQTLKCMACCRLRKPEAADRAADECLGQKSFQRRKQIQVRRGQIHRVKLDYMINRLDESLQPSEYLKHVRTPEALARLLC